MNDNFLCKALVRVEGCLNAIPEGFEQPREDLSDLFVREINIDPCSFNEAVSGIVNDLEKMRELLLLLNETYDLAVFLHLGITVDDMEYILISIPVDLSTVLSSLSIKLELSFMTL